MPSPQNAHAPPAEAIAMLKADHQRVKDLFAHYEATSNLDTKRTWAEHVFVELETQGDRILIPCNDVDRRLESDRITGS